jgi:hypothetical protein
VSIHVKLHLWHPLDQVWNREEEKLTELLFGRVTTTSFHTGQVSNQIVNMISKKIAHFHNWQLQNCSDSGVFLKT